MPLESEIQSLTAAVENLAFIIKQMNVIQSSNTLAADKIKINQDTTKMVKDSILTGNAPLRTDAEVNQDPVALNTMTTVVNAFMQSSAGVPVTSPFPTSAPAVAMPPVPTFITPAPAPQVTHGKAPFSDSKGLMTYVMLSYQALGTEKGAQIQTVLTGLGYQNINDIKPEHYDALFAGVEALK